MNRLRHQFVDYIPQKLDSGVIYIAPEFGTVTHLCCCGCGNEVVTPLSPKDWKLIFDGDTVTLHPSVGSWSLPCRSHYWIRQNRAVWVMDDEEPKFIESSSKKKPKRRWTHLWAKIVDTVL